MKRESESADTKPKRHWVGGRKPTREETRTAIEGMRELQKRCRLDGLNIKALIEEGRR